jgi:hypothetical protein
MARAKMLHSSASCNAVHACLVEYGRWLPFEAITGKFVSGALKQVPYRRIYYSSLGLTTSVKIARI